MDIMQIFQWESIQQSTPFWIHIVAGSIAGLSEHISMLPLDNIKTHCQAGSHLKLRNIAKNIYRAGGLSNFYSGSSILAIGCIPAHAIYFSIYEKSKSILVGDPKQVSLMFGAVGAISSLFHDMVMTPTQVIKQRLQLMRSQKGNWIRNLELIRSMYHNEGLIAFYRSFGINYLMNIPFSSMLIMFNENLKLSFKIKEDGNNHWKYYLLGGIAGGLASIPTTPFDVIKTKLNTQNCMNNQCDKKVICQIIKNSTENQAAWKNKAKLSQMMISTGKSVVKYKNIFESAQIIYKEQGLSGFFKGLKMRMTIQSFSSGIAWGTYHLSKNLLNNKKNNF